MRTRKEVENDISSLGQTAGKLQAELLTLDALEQEHLDQAGKAVIAGGKESRSMAALADVRARREVLARAHKMASDRLEMVRSELEDLNKSERQSAWSVFERDAWQELEAMQSAIGVNGLKGQLDQLNAQIRQAREKNLGESVQDGMLKLNRMESAYVYAARGLYEAYTAIVEARSIQSGATISPDVIRAGFGRLP